MESCPCPSPVEKSEESKDPRPCRACPPPIDTFTESTTTSENVGDKDLGRLEIISCSVLPSSGLDKESGLSGLSTPEGSPRTVVAQTHSFFPAKDVGTESTTAGETASESGENKVPTTPTSASSVLATDGFPTPDTPRDVGMPHPQAQTHQTHWQPFPFHQTVASPTGGYHLAAPGTPSGGGYHLTAPGTPSGGHYAASPTAMYSPCGVSQPELLWYRVAFIGGIDVRAGPDVNSPKVGITLPCNHVFSVCQYFHGDAQDRRTYLRLADGRGWVFDDSAIYPDNPSVKRGNWQPAQPVLVPR